MTKVNVARIAVLALALVAAGLAAFLARSMLSSAPQEAETAKVEQVPTAEVLVAAQNISLGARIGKADLRWQPWPENALSNAYITRARRADAVEAFVGSIARSPLIGGEPVTEGKLVSFDNAGFMAALIKPGHRAVSIKTSPETGAGGFILPNDSVDVLVTERGTGSSDSGDSGYRTETILRDVRVLAIDQTFKEVEGEQVVVGKTATLELTPEQAETLAQASAQGTISLSLRSLALKDGGVVEDDSQTSYRKVRDVRVIRYGAGTTVRPKIGG